jgi:UDP-N-acetylmuramate--alanine ligase
MDDFALSFGAATRLYLMDIYAASEMPIEGINSETLLGRMKSLGIMNAEHISDRSGMIKKVLGELRPGDVVLTLGAGDVYKMGEEILKKL